MYDIISTHFTTGWQIMTTAMTFHFKHTHQQQKIDIIKVHTFFTTFTIIHDTKTAVTVQSVTGKSKVRKKKTTLTIY